MKRTKPPDPKKHRQPYIKIYTTPEVVQKFTKRAHAQNRSVSKHGEFLVRQDLSLAS